MLQLPILEAQFLNPGLKTLHESDMLYKSDFLRFCAGFAILENIYGKMASFLIKYCSLFLILIGLAVWNTCERIFDLTTVQRPSLANGSLNFCSFHNSKLKL